MIDKETAIELAKQAGGLLTEFGINCTKGMRFHNLDTLTSLCNLAIAHAQKDAGKTLITPGGGAPGDPCGILAAKDAEPVAWAMHREDGLVFDVICPEEHQSYEGKYTLPLFTRPAHDDTAPKLPFPEADLTGVSVCCGDYAHCGRPCTPRGRWQASVDDTALLRMALGQLGCNTENMSKGMSKSIQKLCARENTEAITALRERLGEKS